MLRDLIDIHGDRSSSFLTARPEFMSCLDHTIRYQTTPATWIAANEPLTPHDQRAQAFGEFATLAARTRRRAVMFPIGHALAQELRAEGYAIQPIGAEPIFDLSSYFGSYFGSQEPLDFLPVARELKRRGARMREITVPSEQERKTLNTIREHWINAKPIGEMGFLNRVDPWFEMSKRRLFVLELRSHIQAYVSAVPVAPGASLYFAETLRAPQARASSLELLLIECMRSLHQEGMRTVRLGLCPLAHLPKSRPFSLSWILNCVFNRISSPYSFKSIYEFKNKLRPSRWEPAYLASSSKIGVAVFYDIARIHLPLDVWGAFVKRKLLRVKSIASAAPRWTAAGTLLLIALHGFKYTPAGQSLYSQSAYVPGAVTGLGVLLGPLFHTNAYHFLGDLLSFVFFGAVLEYFSGRRAWLPVVFFGLFLSNPLTRELVAPFASSDFWLEKDYGSSNAAYALAGAVAYYLKRPSVLFVPFLINGALLCLMKQSYLSLHHLVALFGGWGISFVQKRKDLKN